MDEGDCAKWKKKIDRCRKRYGERSERCAVPELEQKRCLAFQYCNDKQQAAKYYYGNNMNSSGSDNSSVGANKYWDSNTIENKSICSSFEESNVYGNPRIMNIDSIKESKMKTRIFEHHQKAKRKILNNRQKFNDCKRISNKLHQCLRNHTT